MSKKSAVAGHQHIWTPLSPVKCIRCGRHLLPWRQRLTAKAKWIWLVIRCWWRS